MRAVDSLDICTLMGSFLQNMQRFRWKNTEELCLMTLKSEAKFEEKLILGYKNSMMDLVSFNASEQLLQVWHFALWYATFVNSI